MSINPEIIGTIAGLLTTLCYVPQTVKAIRHDDTKAISLLMYILFVTGVSFWAVYGFMIDSLPIKIWNLVVLPFGLTILYKKIHNLRNGKDK